VKSVFFIEKGSIYHGFPRLVNKFLIPPEIVSTPGSQQAASSRFERRGSPSPSVRVRKTTPDQ